LLDIVSLAKKGPGRRESWSREERELIHRTMRGSPEVMVKVLSQGAGTAKAVAKHMAYLSRRGELELETDDGQRVQGKAAEKDLLDDWEISSSGGRRYLDRRSVATGKSPRLVHKLMFSMPPGSPPEKVLEAVKMLARNEFALKHRYAMVLHTDEPHPHVHVVVKALGEDGKRLNIKKPALRRWRHEFARNLRELGVDANATERVARGQLDRSPPDRVYRLLVRVQTWRHVRGASGTTYRRSSSPELPRDIEAGWNAIGRLLHLEGNREPFVRAFKHVGEATGLERLAARKSAMLARDKEEDRMP
jgi:hypothetical protein